MEIPKTFQNNSSNPQLLDVDEQPFNSSEMLHKNDRQELEEYTTMIKPPRSETRLLQENVQPKRYTMDTATTLSPPPPQSSKRRGSLFFRVFARRRSQLSTGSTATDDELDLGVVGLDTLKASPPRSRRVTMDTCTMQTSSSSSSSTPLSNTATLISPEVTVSARSADFVRRVPPKSSSFGGIKRVMTQRRATMDLALSQHTPRNRSASTIEEGRDYGEQQRALQRKADDLAKGGQVEPAIAVWVQALQLAQENQDTLATKTELMCTIMGLHLQLAVNNTNTNNRVQLSQEDWQRRSRFHKQAAKRYVHLIKPALVQPSWLAPASKDWLEFFMETQAWELALVVAEQLVKEPRVGVSPAHLATVHFQVASLKLDSHRQGEALQHLQATVKYLQQDATKDMEMYCQVLQLLAVEYANQGQYQLAVDAWKEKLQNAPPEAKAKIYCQMATEAYIPMHQLDNALEHLSNAQAIADTKDADIQLQLLQTKADVLCRLGNLEQSLEVYETALEQVESNPTPPNPADKAKILYTMGRLCVKLKRTRQAVLYFTRELEITERALGNHLSVSRVLHELARLYDEGLGDYKMALVKYKQAFKVEYNVLQQCQAQILKCPRCNPATHRACQSHAAIQKDCSQQIRETKKCQGRIHFKLGDFEKALATSMPGMLEQ